MDSIESGQLWRGRGRTGRQTCRGRWRGEGRGRGGGGICSATSYVSNLIMHMFFSSCSLPQLLPPPPPLRPFSLLLSHFPLSLPPSCPPSLIPLLPPTLLLSPSFLVCLSSLHPSLPPQLVQSHADRCMYAHKLKSQDTLPETSGHEKGEESEKQKASVMTHVRPLPVGYTLLPW